MRLLCILLVLCALLPTDTVDWPTYGGNPAGNRYSPLNQINAQNVAQRQPAWAFDTGENNDPSGKGMDIQCQPIVVDGVLFGTTPTHKLFAA